MNPTFLEIIDDSTAHAEHEAMRENGYNETHFKVLVVSEAFKPKVSIRFSLYLAYIYYSFFLDAGTKT